MIANKTKQMSTEILNFDSALLSPTEQSFFSDDCPQSQHFSEITPQLDSDEWIREFEDIRSFCDFDFNLNNEPELTLEAITKEVDTQHHSKANEIIDYLDSSAFLSPLSTAPSSPQSVYDNSADTSAITLLEELLSANSSDSEFISNECLDSELNIQMITEVSKDSKNDEILPPETKSIPKRQYKRKALQTNENLKPIKKNKTITEKKERKRKQNKSAANRYRQKKRAELDDIEEQRNKFLEINNELRAQLQKLQMEFKVVCPLAEAAFASDPLKATQLLMLGSRVQTHNLLD
jgi:hypothetical protein